MRAGTADLGFYADPTQRLSITRVRIASDLPAAERPHLQLLNETSAAIVELCDGRTLEAIVDALGIVGSMAGGIIEYLAEGAWTKRPLTC